MPTPIPHAEVLIGIAEGKTAQYRAPSGAWCAEDPLSEYNPLTNPHWEWRLKPEPKVVKVRVYRHRIPRRTCASITVPGDYRSIEEAEEDHDPSRHIWLSPWTDIEVTDHE